jgi:hypothetical protein
LINAHEEESVEKFVHLELKPERKSYLSVNTVVVVVVVVVQVSPNFLAGIRAL